MIEIVRAIFILTWSLITFILFTQVGSELFTLPIFIAKMVKSVDDSTTDSLYNGILYGGYAIMAIWYGSFLYVLLKPERKIDETGENKS